MWVNSSSLGFRLVTYKVGIIKLRSWDNIHIHNKIPQCVLNKMYIYIVSQLWRLQVQGQAVSGVGSLIAVRQKVLQCPLPLPGTLLPILGTSCLVLLCLPLHLAFSLCDCVWVPFFLACTHHIGIGAHPLPK